MQLGELISGLALALLIFSDILVFSLVFFLIAAMLRHMTSASRDNFSCRRVSISQYLAFTLFHRSEKNNTSER